MPPKYWGSSDGIHLKTHSRDVAETVRQKIKEELISKLAEMKILSMRVDEARDVEGPTLRQQRLRRAASDVLEMQSSVEDVHNIILCFGSSWRNAREFVVIRTEVSEMKEHMSPSPLHVDPNKEVQQLCSRFWRHFFQLMSEPELEWLTRSSSSRSYAMHLLADRSKSGWCTAIPSGGFKPNSKYAVAFIDVAIGGDDIKFRSEEVIFASPISIKTP